MSEHQIAFEKIQRLLNTKESAALGPEARSGREPLPSLAAKLDTIFSETKVALSTQPLIRSLVLLWHDHLDESHSISQEIHSADGSFLHGIMHRREPDFGNAKYWFHRVGEHPACSMIARKAAESVQGAASHNLKIFHDDTFDPFAFVDACEIALRKNDEPAISVLKQIQEIEFKTLLEYFLR